MSITNVVRSTGVTSEPERPVEPKMLVLSATLMVIGFFALPIAGVFHPVGRSTIIERCSPSTPAAWDGRQTTLAFFAAYAITIAGLIVLCYALDLKSGMPRQLSRLGIAAAGAALALSAVRFAVDGVVLKRAVDAWMRAPEAEKPARFASAELARWIEEATVSYQSYLLAAAALLLGIVIVATARIPRLIGYLLIIGGVAYLVLGWLVGENGFAAAGAVPSYAAQFAQLIWSVCLFVVAWRVRGSTTPAA